MHDLYPYLKLLAGRRWRLIAGSLLMLLTAAAAVGLLSLSGWFITATAVTAMLWAAGTRVAFDVYVPGGGIRLFALTRTVARYFERLYNHDTVLRLLADLRGRVFAAFARLDALTLERLRAAELLHRLTSDIDTLDNLYLRLLAPPIVALLGIVAVTILIGLFKLPTALVAGAVLMLLLLWVTVVAALRSASISERLAGLAETLRVRLVEQFQGLAELSAYDTLANHRRVLAAEEAALLTDQRRLGRRVAAGNACVTTGVQLSAVLVLLLGVQAYQADAISAPVMVLLPLAIIGLGEVFLALPVAFTWAGGTRAAARRLTTEVSREPQVLSPADPAAMPEQNDVAFEAIGFRYPYAEAPVLQGIDLNVAAAERIAVLGASGAGKSTLAKLIARLLDPSVGSIRIGGLDIRQFDLHELWTRVASLTQRSDLFEDTIAANLRIASPSASDSELWQALHIVDLDRLIRSLPAGLDTRIGESGRRLSGGEGRRLALARLLLRDPGIIVLDEPLAGLDAATAAMVGQRLDGWLQGRTVFVFGHDLAALPAIDRAFMLHGGRLELCS